jgi:triacylglycerol lipase
VRSTRDALDVAADCSDESAMRSGAKGFIAAVAVGAALSGACGSSGQDNSATATGAGGFVTGASSSGTASHSASASVSSSSSGTGGSGGMTGSGPPYPVVLAHGFFGFEKFAGQDFLTYFYGVKDYLAQKGEMVTTPSVDPFNDSTTRGAQLADRVHEVLMQTGAAKVNIIGHSQGGLDARVVAHDHPDWVASVVTVATPHHGTPISDIALKLLADPNAQQIIDQLANLIGAPLYDQIGNTTSVVKGLSQFSQQGIADFNAKYPDAPGVYYASIGGRSNLKGKDADCTGTFAIPFLKALDGDVDPVDPLLSITGLALSNGVDGVSNDGLVRAKDAQWGDFWGCVPADHLDEIGQLFGDDPGIGNGFNHKDFYWKLVSYLRFKGY